MHLQLFESSNVCLTAIGVKPALVNRLKGIKQGIDTKQVIVRFEVEKQAITLSDHPNILLVSIGISMS